MNGHIAVISHFEWLIIEISLFTSLLSCSWKLPSMGSFPDRQLWSVTMGSGPIWCQCILLKTNWTENHSNSKRLWTIDLMYRVTHSIMWFVSWSWYCGYTIMVNTSWMSLRYSYGQNHCWRNSVCQATSVEGNEQNKSSRLCDMAIFISSTVNSVMSRNAKWT